MGRGVILVLAGVGWVVSVVATDARDGGLANSAEQTALEFFKSHSADFDGLLRRDRPPALTAQAKAAAIDLLPEQGELVPTARQATKLATIRSVLAFHDREHDLESRLISVGPQAAVGLYARAVLLFSNEAVDLLTAEELQAVTAHELGHEYVWDQYQAAQMRQDTAMLQVLELRCDGIALITLNRLGLDPKHLLSGASRMTGYNERTGATATAGNYVPLPERQRFIRAMTTLVVSTAPANRAPRPAR
jgi:hypothetical protein